MNKLPIAKRVKILSMLCEGNSMRSISHAVDVSINTVTKLLEDAGETCLALHDEHIRNVRASRVQCDEIWSFVYSREKTVEAAKAAVDGAGDVWTWTALDADSKMIVSYFVGDRSGQSAIILIDDLRARLANRIQLTTDGHKAYLEAVEGAFEGDVDYAQLLKLYGDVPKAAKGRYSPAECTGISKLKVEVDSDLEAASTSDVDRQSLTMRISMRRFTRLTNGFSKKLDNHIAALALYFMHYNFCWVHKSLRMSPAMAAGVATRLWSTDDIVAAMDARAPQPGKRGPYKKRVTGNSN